MRVGFTGILPVSEARSAGKFLLLWSLTEWVGVARPTPADTTRLTLKSLPARGTIKPLYRHEIVCN